MRAIWFSLVLLMALCIFCGYKTHQKGMTFAQKAQWVAIPSGTAILLTLAFYRHLSSAYVPRVVLTGANREMQEIGVNESGSMADFTGLAAQLNAKREARREALTYAAVSAFAGVCSGLFGIGGGLVFSPFLLHMNVDPAVAVVTSATNVIFTSTSTTMQYLLLRRIIIPLAIVYGGFAFLGSILGSHLIQFIRERAGNRGSAILMLIVGFAVTTSAVLAIAKGVKEHMEAT